MRVLKVIGYSFIAVSILASCKTISKIPVPKGSDTVINIPYKKGILTDYQKNNWQHLDLLNDTIPGMSVKKAYDFLKGKKSTPIIVGVVDSGTDINHEDLKDIVWINEKEIPNNGIDDDKNGYVDDINGWNFLGDSYAEHLEFERILMKPSIASPELYAEAKKYQDKKVKEAKENKKRYATLLKNVVKSDELLSKKIGKKNYTLSDLAKLNTKNPDLVKAKTMASRMLGFFKDFKEVKDYFMKMSEKADKIIKGDNLKTDYRTVVGDNPYDINDKPGYGNANVSNSEKSEAHGSHVSGIIAAIRDNNIGMNGVANNVKIMAVRSVSDGDEYDKDVALGIRYAVDNGAKIINTSFGKSFSPNKEWVYDAIKYAAKNDVLIVNAAGNDGVNIDVKKTFPNDAPDKENEISDNFLTIGAISSNYSEYLPARFSNYGKLNVDIFAPGVDVYSTVPENGYKKFSGTSMASPSAAGVAALIRSYYPKLSASQVKHIIMNSGTKIDFDVIKPGTQSEKVPFSQLCVSGRIVNAYNAVRMADKMVNGK